MNCLCDLIVFDISQTSLVSGRSYTDLTIILGFNWTCIFIRHSMATVFKVYSFKVSLMSFLHKIKLKKTMITLIIEKKVSDVICNYMFNELKGSRLFDNL